MKFLTFLLFLSLAFFAGILIAHYQVFPYSQIKAVKHYFFSREKTVLQGNRYYSRKVSQHQLQKGQAFDLLFVGDSLIDEGNWAHFFPHEKIANFGINADTTNGILERIETLAGVASSNLFLMIGINDIFLGKKMGIIQENYKRIIERLETRRGKVYLFSCLYAGPTYRQHDSQITALNNFIENLAKTKKQITYIDLNPALAPDGRLSPEYTNDDVHLNGKGYQRWVETIRQYINE